MRDIIHDTSWQELANSLAIGEVVFVETTILYGFFYKLEYNTIALEAVKANHITMELGLICDLNAAEDLCYIENPAEATVVASTTNAELPPCTCDLIKMMQAGCKCGALVPYVGGLGKEIA